MNFSSEFFVNEENKETVWGASYEESTEHHVMSQEQLITQQSKLQQTTLHACYNVKDETVASELAMDMTCMPDASVRNSKQNEMMQSISYIHQKENIFYEATSKHVADKTTYGNSILDKTGTMAQKAEPHIFKTLNRNKDYSLTEKASMDMSIDDSLERKDIEKQLFGETEITESRSAWSIIKAAPSKSYDASENPVCFENNFYF